MQSRIIEVRDLNDCMLDASFDYNNRVWWCFVISLPSNSRIEIMSDRDCREIYFSIR